MSNPINDDELFRLASLIGCEPENEQKHREELLALVRQREDAARIDEAKNARKMTTGVPGPNDFDKRIVKRIEELEAQLRAKQGEQL